jgi:hypothetical protein
MPDVVRKLDKSPNQSFTYDAIGHAEDLSPILTNISPEVTLFYSKFGSTKPATETSFSWFTKGLRPPQDNAHLEYEDYKFEPTGSIEGKSNNVQFFQNTGLVSDVQNEVTKAYNNEHGTDLDDAKFDAMTYQAQDIEYMLVNSDAKVDGTKTVQPRSGGIPYFMSQNTIDVTINSATGTITATEDPKLDTGDIVYFTADKAPAGVTKGMYYYVRIDDTNPKSFTIFDTQKGAVEKIADKQIKPTDTGTNVKLVANNIISLGKTADYTLDDLNNAMEMAFKRGGSPTEAYMSSGKFRRFNELVLATTTAYRKSNTKDKVIEVATSYQGSFGLVNANVHRLYPDDRVDILDMQYWDMRYLSRPHEVPNIAKKGTYEVFAVETRVGLQGTQPKASCSIVDIKR